MKMGTSLDKNDHPKSYYEKLYLEKMNAKNKRTRSNNIFGREYILNTKRERNDKRNKKDEDYVVEEDEESNSIKEEEEEENNENENIYIKSDESDQDTEGKKKPEYKFKRFTTTDLIEKNKKEKIKGTIIVPLLKDIKLEIKQGDLIGIIGEFGSGKTCLFNAILNNLDILNGPNKKIIINGSIAYIPQKPWILNDTMRNNILFNTPYDKQKYDKIVNICQLEPDFELLKLGDMTTISDKGDNLSGGQKSRLNIARAVYNEADIYLFDDPFSALDAFVGKNIFDNVIKKYLKGKTILVITHALQYLPMMDLRLKK